MGVLMNGMDPETCSNIWIGPGVGVAVGRGVAVGWGVAVGVGVGTGVGVGVGTGVGGIVGMAVAVSTGVAVGVSDPPLQPTATRPKAIIKPNANLVLITPSNLHNAHEIDDTINDPV